MFSDFLKFQKNNSFKLDKLGKHWLLGYSNPVELSQRVNGTNEKHTKKIIKEGTTGFSISYLLIKQQAVDNFPF